VETLSTAADYTQVRLGDGVTGWVKSTFLTTNVPATVRVKQLQDELDRNRATTPALAEAAARSELERLQHELADTQSQLAAALMARGAASAADAPVAPVARRSIGLGTAACALLAVAGARVLAGICHPCTTHPAQVRWAQSLLKESAGIREDRGPAVRL